MTFEEIAAELDNIEIYDNAVSFIDYYFDNGFITQKEWSLLYQGICDAKLF